MATEREEPVMLLISVILTAMANEDGKDDEPELEATFFDAVTHLRELGDVFSYFGADVYKRVLYNICQNAGWFLSGASSTVWCTTSAPPPYPAFAAQAPVFAAAFASS